MASRNGSGRDRSGIGRYDEYNGFGEFRRDERLDFDDSDDRVMQALRGNAGGGRYPEDEDGYYGDGEPYYESQNGGGGYYPEDEDGYYEDDYYDEDGYYEDDYYEDGPYPEDDEYYEEDDYYEDDYYEDEPRVRGGRAPRQRQKAPGKSAPRPKKSRPARGRKPAPSKPQKGRKGAPPKGGKKGGPNEPKKKKRWVLFIIEMLVFAVLLVALFIMMKWSKVNKEELKESQIYINEELKAVLDEDLESSENGKDEWGMKEYKNVALFGVDAGGTRSDTIIIASINTKTNEVKMCSVYRDTYLNIDSMENPTYNKANSAYAKGGPEQAIRMLNMNLDMNVDDFVTVDFAALEEVIDDLGGVEIDVQPEEVDYINDYQFSIVMDLGGPNEGKIKNPRNFTAVTEPGLQTLNGLQATAYCRIRYTAGSDFRRTERQRAVISQIVEKAKKASLPQLNSIMDDVLPKITTSFTAAEFAAYASKVGSYSIGESKGFPFENVTGNIGKQSMVVPDTLVMNVAEMHTFLFGPSQYSPTTAVQEISEKIEADRVKSGL